MPPAAVLAVEMSSAIKTFSWWQGHKSQRKEKWKVNDSTAWLAGAVFPNCLYPELFRTSSASRADEEGGHWQHRRNKSPRPSSLTTLGFLFLSEQGEASTGLSGPHLSGISNKSEFDMKLTGCSWRCWWQPESPPESPKLLTCPHKAEEECDKLASEIWPPCETVSAESSSLRRKDWVSQIRAMQPHLWSGRTLFSFLAQESKVQLIHWEIQD